MNYMLDTNICIYAIKNKPASVLINLKKHLDDGLYISSITASELWYGVYKSNAIEKNAKALTQFLSILTILPFDDMCALEYGNVCAYLYKNGTPIGTMDMLIASHAKSKNMILVTNNVREFERVPNLKIENWIS